MPDDDTRSRLIEAARELFYRQGYAATGIAQILREAGVHSGSLYHFFDSKEELLLAVLHRYREMLRSHVLEPAERAAEDPVERVFSLLAFYRAGLIETGCTAGCPIGNLALELSDSHPRVRDLIAENFEGWRGGVRAWLSALAERLPPGSDPDSLATFVLTVMEGAVMQSRAAGGIERFDQSVSTLRRCFDSLLDRR